MKDRENWIISAPDWIAPVIVVSLIVIVSLFAARSCNKIGVLGGLDQPCYRDGTCDMDYVCTEYYGEHSHICAVKKSTK